MRQLMRFKFLLGVALICATPLFGQSTTVTITAQDQSGQVWNNGTISYVFQGNGAYGGKYQWQGFNLNASYLTPTTVTLSSTGTASFSLPSSTAIVPAGSTWQFTVCPNASSIVCTIVNLSITGGTQDISSAVQAASPVISMAPGALPLAYTDSEIKTVPVQGGLYYNTTTSTVRYFDGTTWHPIGGGGGVTSIDGLTGAFTFTGAGVSHVGNAYTFTGGGGGCTSGCYLLSPTTNQNINYPAGTHEEYASTDWGPLAMYGPSYARKEFFLFDNYTGDTGANNVGGDVRLHQMDTFVTIPGWSRQIDWGWFVFSDFSQNLIMQQAGIVNGFQLLVRKNGDGDFNGQDFHVSCIGGATALSDEGCSMSQWELTNTVGPKHTTVTSGGIAGAQTIGVGGADNIGAGGMVLNTSSSRVFTNVGTLAGNMSIGSAGGVAAIMHLATPLTTAQTGFGCGTTTADIVPARPANGADVSVTMTLTLPSAYSQSSPTIAGVSTLDANGAVTITSVGSYSGGVQTLTVNTAFPIYSGAKVCIGGIANSAMQNNSIASWSPFMVYVVGAIDANNILVETLNQGRISLDYVEAGNIAIFPMAFIRAANQNTNVLSLGDNNVQFNTGDNIYVPVANAQIFKWGNWKIENNNPHAQFRGLEMFYYGVPFRVAGGGQFFSIQGIDPGVAVDIGASGCYNAGTCGYAPNLFDIQGIVGNGMHFHNFPSSADFSGNTIQSAVLWASCEIQNSANTCQTDLTWMNYHDYSSQRNSSLIYTVSTSTWNFSGTSTQNVTVNNSPVCTVANGLCGSGPSGGVSSIDSLTGAFTFTGAGVSHSGNTYTFSGGGGGGGVTSIDTLTGAFVFTGSGVSHSGNTYTFTNSASAGGENEVQAADGGGGFLDTGCSSTSSYMQCNSGFRIGGATTTGHYLRNNGTGFVDSALLAGDLPIASTSAIGGVRVDGTTITISGGIISAVGGGGGGSGITGATAGQALIAGSATTATSSYAIAGAGAGLTTGPITSTVNRVVTFGSTPGQIQDSGVLLSSLCNVGNGCSFGVITLTRPPSETITTITAAASVNVTKINIISGSTTITTFTMTNTTSTTLGFTFDFLSSGVVTLGGGGNIQTPMTTTAGVSYHCVMYGTTNGVYCK